MTKTLEDIIDEIYHLAEWHCDDDADESNQSPEDMTAHINGLIRQRCIEALRQLDRKEK